ncbi:MAG: formate/nitrite transporter family protein [Thermaerobacter sp.]|nr:formate/nitrite transporter family protein [Thermaerobacter sp.]
MRILLVEESGELADLVRRSLEADGHQVTVADSGAAAAELLRRDPYFQLLVLDEQLPDGTGEEWGRRYREELQLGTPVLLLGGKRALEAERRGGPVLEREEILEGLRSFIRSEVQPHLAASGRLGEVLSQVREAIEIATEREAPMGAEPAEIFQSAIKVGERRLKRAWLEMLSSGFIAGMNVTFGALGAALVSAAFLPAVGPLGATVAGAVVFPVGFIFLSIGKSELFTENFLIPTTAVLARRGRTRQLFRLWGLTLLGNVLGAALFAYLLSRGTDVFHAAGIRYVVDLARHKVSQGFFSTALSGVFAGWLITLMTWLIVASRGTQAKIMVIWCVGFLIYLNGFNHVVVNSSEIFFAMDEGFRISYASWFAHFFLPVALGNFVGGTVFVTLLQYLQVLKAGESMELAPAASDLASTEDTV